MVVWVLFLGICKPSPPFSLFLAVGCEVLDADALSQLFPHNISPGLVTLAGFMGPETLGPFHQRRGRQTQSRSRAGQT